MNISRLILSENVVVTGPPPLKYARGALKFSEIICGECRHRRSFPWYTHDVNACSPMCVRCKRDLWPGVVWVAAQAVLRGTDDIRLFRDTLEECAPCP